MKQSDCSRVQAFSISLFFRRQTSSRRRILKPPPSTEHLRQQPLALRPSSVNLQDSLTRPLSRGPSRALHNPYTETAVRRLAIAPRPPKHPSAIYHLSPSRKSTTRLSKLALDVASLGVAKVVVGDGPGEDGVACLYAKDG